MKAITVTSENFEKEVLKSDKPVLVDFFADWCGPCQMMSPVIEELAEESDAYKVAEVNIDEEDVLAAKNEVSSIPCLIIFKDGKEVSRNVGVVPKKKLAKLLEKTYAV